MSCGRMENKILGYVDGRLKEGEQLEMEKHLSTCGVCQLRVNEFRSVHALLDELPMIEPSAAFDLRVHARVAAEPAKQSWWAWFAPSPRVVFAASILALAMVWVGRYSVSDAPQMDQADIPVVENYDVISSFEPLTELSQAEPADNADQQSQDM